MIYIENTSKFIEIPKHSISYNTGFELELYNILNKTTITYFKLVNIGNDTMYMFDGLDFSSLVDGEYEYRLNDEDGLLECGLLQIGEYKKITTQYESEKEGKQYES